VRGLPEFFDLRVEARSLAYLFVAGAMLGLLTLVFPHSPEIRDRELVALAGVATSMGLAMYAWADRMRTWQLHAALATGTLILTLANYLASAAVLYPLLYTWTALFAFYFFPLGIALLHMALIAAGYGIVLAAVEPSSAVVRWLLAVGTPLIAGLLISQLLSRLRVAALQSEERAHAFQESEARTRLVLDSAPDAFITLDREGVISSWNTASERLFGWSAAEAVGQTMRSLIVPPEFRDRHDERRRALFATPEVVATQRYDVELLRRDGARFPAEATVSKIEIKGEAFVSGFIRDVTERQRRQQEREVLLREQAARAEAERVAEMVGGMQQLVDAALASGRLEEIVEDLVTKVRGVLSADAATIFLAEEGELLRMAASSAGRADESRPAPFPFGDGFPGRVARAREAMLTQEPDLDQLRDPGLRQLAIDSIIGVPLLVKKKVIGVLMAGKAAPRHFGAEDLTLLRLAADRVALAILHARVYEREHRIAETLQGSLLPERLPRVPGLQLAARYRPAAAEARVGGDWYDVIATPGGGIGLVMGDVAGKGLAAAEMVGRLRSALRAYALEGHEPTQVVEQLNRLVWAEAGDNKMATLLYAVVDPGESRIDWVSAGHLSPLLVAGAHRPHFLNGGGSVPLGVVPFPAYEQRSAAMDPGSTVVLYTDGLVERPGEHIDEGMARLAARVHEASDDPEALCTHLLATLVPAKGAPDDVAILTLRNLPVVDHFREEFPAEPETLAGLRSMLRRWLGHAEASEHEIAEITMACGEAATNAIEHAGVAEPFVVSGTLRERVVEISVSDRGAWRQIRAGDQGRGLSLMGALMDTVDVTPSADGTTVRLRRKL
jgi:PAS domain S-box-containing protein